MFALDPSLQTIQSKPNPDADSELTEGETEGSDKSDDKEDIDRLRTNIAQVAAHRKLIERTLSGDFWRNAVDMLFNTAVIEELVILVKKLAA